MSVEQDLLPGSVASRPEWDVDLLAGPAENPKLGAHTSSRTCVYTRVSVGGDL